MQYKRNKIVLGLTGFVPESINFSEFEKPNINDEDSVVSQFGDDGLFSEKMEANFEFEELIVQILFSLEGEERIVFLYQLLRDFGYQIDHGSFAKTLFMKRQKYMHVLKNVRRKIMIILDQRSLHKKQTAFS